MIVTQVFGDLARQLLQSMGYPDVPVLVTPGPVVFRDAAAIEERVTSLLAGVTRSLCAPQEDGGHA